MAHLSIKNYYYLAAGILSVLAALGHAVYTQQLVIPELESSDLAQFFQDATFLSWHLSTSTSLVSALGLFIMTFYKNRSATIPLVAFVIAINIGRYLMFLGTGLFRNQELFRDMVPNTIFMILYLGVMVLGIRKEIKRASTL